jgi:hypothetical protein
MSESWATRLRDALGIVGVGCVSYGAWAIYHPLGFLTGGLLLIAGAVLGARGE